MSEWSFLTNHARVLVSIAHDPGVRLHDSAATVGITERRADPILTDLTAAAYVVKDKGTDGRRNRYQIQTHLPQPEVMARERTIGEGPGRTPRQQHRQIGPPSTLGWAGPDRPRMPPGRHGAMTAKNVFAPKRPANLFHQTSVRPGKRESRSRKCIAP